MAVNTNCESLALEIGYMMPNNTALEGAIRYASVKKRTGLAQKLGEIAEEKQIEQSVPEEEVEEFIPVPNRFTAINVEKTSENFDLKPKPITRNLRNKDRVLENSSSSEEELEEKESTRVDSNNSDDEETLRPKKMKSKTKTTNPFKLSAKSKKRIRPIDDDDDDLGFEAFFDEMKNTFEEDNSDLDEADLRDLMLDHFNRLEREEREEWTSKAIKCDKTQIKKKKKDVKKLTDYYRKN